MDEKVLIEAIWKLDEEALGAAFEQYAPLIFKYALRTFRDPLEADDVVGEVFSRLVDGLSKGKGPRDNLRSYLYQTAYHIIVDNVRASKYYAPPEEVLNERSSQNPTGEAAEANQKLLLLQAALNADLTDDQRHVITLRFLEGFDLRETALILDKEINNVKVIQNRAIAKLRQALDGSLVEES
jgi:RNA polymerase sigma-70 factor, ECF subfamily